MTSLEEAESVSGEQDGSTAVKQARSHESVDYSPCSLPEMEQVPPAQPALRHCRTSLASITAALSSFTMGSVIGYTAPAIPDINSHSNQFSLDDTAIAVLTSIIAIGGIVGELTGGYLSDRFGRHRTLVLNSMTSISGWLLVACAPNVHSMYAGRFLTGLACGIADIAVPVYISEISHSSVRGLFCSCHETFINLGMLYVFACGIFLHWNHLAVACLAIPVIMPLLLYFTPESPRWLLSNKGREKAEVAIKWLRGADAKLEVEAELEEIAENAATSGSEMHWKEMSQPILYKPVGIVMSLLFFQQMAGYNMLPQYMVSIFQSAGFHSVFEDRYNSSSTADWNNLRNPYVQTAVVGFAGVLANVLSAFVVDRLGRRVMLLLSSAVMAFSLTGLASFFTIKELGASNDSLQSQVIWLPMLSLIMFYFGCSLGMGPIPFYLSSELLPLRARSRAGSLNVTFCWILVFITTLSYNVLWDYLQFWLYWMLCGFATLGFLFIYVVVPETKGLTLETIEKIFGN